MKKYSLIAVLCGFLLAISTEAQENPSLDDQLRAHLHKEYFTLNLLIQSEGRFSFEDNDFQGGRSFNAANGRISMRGNLKGGFFYRIFVDGAPEPALLDVFAGYKLNDALSFMVGSMKPRQTLDFLPDPGSHNFVDRTTMTFGRW